MKRFVTAVTLMALTTVPLLSTDMDAYQEATNDVFRTGAGSEDGAFCAIATSMLGWGIGLALGIGILASVLHQSGSSHAHDQTGVSD